jgi:hypothetical protein
MEKNNNQEGFHKTNINWYIPTLINLHTNTYFMRNFI